jgi:hypothetical protein
MHWLFWALPVLALAIVSFLTKIILSPSLEYHSFLYKVKAALIFWFGDIRRLDSCPWATWASKNHIMSHRDARKGSEASLPGDIGLHRDVGYLSNFGIPGAFKHAWVCVEDNYCVEALSEGVVKRDEMAPLLSDYAVVLRPNGVTQDDVAEAVARANALVGNEYDANFQFDFEVANALFRKDAERDFNSGAADNLKEGKIDMAFSCTEVAGFSWFHKARHLRIFRSMHAGRPAVIADDFFKMNFDVVYASQSVTPEWAEGIGLHEEGIQKIMDYWSSRGTGPA